MKVGFFILEQINEITNEQKDQLQILLTVENIARLKVCAWIVIFLELFLMGRNFYLKGLSLNYYIVLYLALALISIVILLGVYQSAKIKDITKRTKINFIILLFYYWVMLVWGVVLTVIDQSANGHVTAYLTNFMTISLLFIVSPKQYLLIHGAPIVALLIGIMLTQDDISVAMAHYVNITVFIIFCVIGSRMMYTMYLKGYYQEIQLSQKNDILAQLNEDLAYLAIMDPLTQVKNVRGMRQYIEQHNEEKHKNVSVMIFDVDSFKQYNDYYGHLAGDEVLIDVAAAVQNIVEPAHFIARSGGEEFVIIAFDISPDEADVLAERIRQAVENLQIEHKKSITSPYVTISLGYITEKVAYESSFESLQNKADEALYYVKENGRNNSRCYVTV